MFMRDMAWSTVSLGAGCGPFFAGNVGNGLSWGTFLGTTGLSRERSRPAHSISIRADMQMYRFAVCTIFLRTHLAVSILLAPAADWGHHFLALMAYFSHLVAHPGAPLVLLLGVGLVVVGEVHCTPVVAHSGSAAVVFVSGSAEAVLRIYSRRHARHAVVSPPICPAGHSTRHSTARSRPGRGRNRSIAGRTGCRSLRTAAAVRAPGRNSAAAGAVGSCRIAVAGRPWRRNRMLKPQTRPMARLASRR